MSSSMFEVDVAGLFELEGGKPPFRLAYEPIANVFDEFRGYADDRRRPSFCGITIKRNEEGRGVLLTITDDGPGFANERDIWTFFGTSAKRGVEGVAGRNNAGEKFLIACARKATIKTNSTTVVFEDGKRTVTNHRSPIVSGTSVEVLMPWSVTDIDEVFDAIRDILPPYALKCTVNGFEVSAPTPLHIVEPTLPTLKLTDGVMRDTLRKSQVYVLQTRTPMLYELGIPVCSIADIGFPYSLNVQQKIPLPMSRDSVSTAYLYRLIGGVLEQAALDGKSLLTIEQQGSGFIRGALDWIRDANALGAVVSDIYGSDAVRVSSDPMANAQAAAAGRTMISGREFTEATRHRLNDARVLPTSKQVFGGLTTPPSSMAPDGKCPTCGQSLPK